jgi:hypothetical protein
MLATKNQQLREKTVEFNTDNYETPNHIAKAMASLVLHSDKKILEPCAGNGQIAQFLPDHAHCNEILLDRYEQLSCFAKNVSNKDFLLDDFETYDLIITNPPFSVCLEFIEKGIYLLNRDNPDARLIFLMPLDWNCAKSRAKIWSSFDAHIHHVYRIPQRVDYLMNGKPCSRTQKVKNGEPVFSASGTPIMMSGRQCYDAVFDIRPGKHTPASSYLL